MKENEEIATELQEDLFGELKHETEKEKLFQRKFQYNKIDCVREGLRREIEISNNIFVNDLISDVDLDSDETSIICMDGSKVPNEVSNRIKILRRKGSRWLEEEISISNKAKTETIAIYEALKTAIGGTGIKQTTILSNSKGVLRNVQASHKNMAKQNTKPLMDNNHY